jgi:manganese transport protein
MRPWLRRLVTRGIAIVPAVLVTALYGEQGAGSLLVASQVLLSLQLPFAVVPLILFTSDRRSMGEFANRRAVSLLAWAIAALIVGLNGWLLWATLAG